MDALSRWVLTFVFNSIWQVALVVGAAAIADLCLRRAPARYRHALWVVSLVAAILLPVASVPESKVNSTLANAARQVPVAASAAFSSAPDSTVIVRANSRHTPLGRIRNVIVAGVHPSIPVPRPMMRAFLIVYASFLVFMVLRFARACLRAHTIRRFACAEPPAAHIVATLERCRRAMTRGVAQTCFSRSAAFLQMCVGPAKAADLEKQVCATRALNPAILWSAQVPGPVTVGALRGAIILPTNLRDGGACDDLEAALAHEMAHVCRFDYLCNLVCELLLLPIAFHPLAWLLRRRQAESRELACDELAARVLDPSRYARSLVRIANQISSRGSAALKLDYTLGVFDANILEERVMTLLKPRASGRLAQLSMLLGSVAIVFSCLLASRFSLGIAPARAASEVPQTQNAAGPDLAAFAGGWQAQFENQPFVKLNLEIQDGKLTGVIRTGDVNLDNDGNLTEVTHAVRSSVPILDAQVAGGNLLFKQQDGSDMLSYEMRVTGADEAKLQMLSTGPVNVQPFTLHRDGYSTAPAGSGNRIAEYHGKLYAVSGGISGGVSGGPSGGVRGGSAAGVPGGVSGGPAGSTSYKTSTSSESEAQGQAESNAKTGSLSGIVVDASGARIPKAEVRLVSRNSSFTQTTESDDTGGFSFDGVPAGRYALEVSSSGMGGSFRSFEFKAEGQPPFFPFVLHPGSVTESAVVTAKAPGSPLKAAAVGPRKIRIGGNVEAGKLIDGTQTPPVYPESARAEGRQGVVLIQAEISPEGVPQDLKVIGSPGDDLSKAAVQAVSQWRYQPTLLNGDPVAVVTTITVDFRLED